MQNTKYKRAAVTRRMRWAGRQTNSRGHRGVYGDTGIIAAQCQSASNSTFLVFIYNAYSCKILQKDQLDIHVQ